MGVGETGLAVSAHVDISYRVTRHLDEDAMAAALERRSAEERARCARLALANDRRDFIAAHALLRHALSAHAHRDPREWVFIPDANGKPELASVPGERPQFAFNLSHSRGLVACVVARDVDVGIDVERVGSGTDIIDLARRHFSSAEVAELERCESGARAARFTELWTLKESYVKATGVGILRGLDECAFTLGAASSLRFNTADTAQADAWQFALLEVLDYRMAVAVRDPGQRLITHRSHRSEARRGVMVW